MVVFFESNAVAGKPPALIYMGQSCLLAILLSSEMLMLSWRAGKDKVRTPSWALGAGDCIHPG